MSDESGIVDTFSDGIPSYEQYAHFASNVIEFQGKTLNQWLDEVALPFIGGRLSIADLEAYNHHFLNTNEVIMRNLGISRSTYDGAKMHYENAVVIAKQAIVDSIHEGNDPKKRLPSADVLHSLAKATCTPQYNAYKIAELFYEFWKVQYDRLKLIDNRLESLNILKRYGDI